MLTEIKTSKYLLYAIGEIMLVVIGILIALWINNENQNYKNRQLANTFLSDFKRDLEADVNTLEENILKNEIIIKNADSIMIASRKKVLSEKENNSFLNWVNSLMGETYYVPEKTTIPPLSHTSQTYQTSTSRSLPVLLVHELG